MLNVATGAAHWIIAPAPIKVPTTLAQEVINA